MQKIVSQVYISEYCPETHVKNFSIVPILLLSTGILFILLKKLGQYFFYTIIFFSSIAIVNEIKTIIIISVMVILIIIGVGFKIFGKNSDYCVSLTTVWQCELVILSYKLYYIEIVSWGKCDLLVLRNGIIIIL